MSLPQAICTYLVGKLPPATQGTGGHDEARYGLPAICHGRTATWLGGPPGRSAGSHSRAVQTAV